MTDGAFVLQKYSIVEKLASGGMAEIYLALRKENQFQNKFYVIKRILPVLADRPEYLIYLKDEAKALSLMQHHNIIGFHEFFFENDQFYLVMEYVNGKTLREIFSDFEKIKYNLPLEQLLYIVMEVAAGLDYAHAAYDHVLDKSLNLVHRDLNPQNIMISFEGHVKIIDFGISKFDIRDEMTKTGMLKGKFGYMSPEQVEGLDVDARTDIFALGILAWELVTNKRLFDGADDFEKFNKIKNLQTVPPSQQNSKLPKDIDFIVMKALAPKAADRYQTAGEMRHAIAKFLAKNYPDFKPEGFNKAIRKIYAGDFQKHVEKLRTYFQKSATEEAEYTKKNREYYQKQAAFEDRRTQRFHRDPNGSGSKIIVPESFELNIHKSKLKLEVPSHEPEKKPFDLFDLEDPVVTEDESKKRTVAPRHTLLEPERYKVHVRNIKVSPFHAWINSYGPRMKVLVYIFCVCAIVWGLQVTYDQGYLHLLFNTLYGLVKEHLF